MQVKYLNWISVVKATCYNFFMRLKSLSVGLKASRFALENFILSSKQSNANF
jgi:hypothetical protein